MRSFGVHETATLACATRTDSANAATARRKTETRDRHIELTLRTGRRTRPSSPDDDEQRHLERLLQLTVSVK
jgi:hypothetical protein